MKQTTWVPLALFSVAAAALRLWQKLSGFEATGLAIPGNLPGMLLPVVLLIAAAFFLISSRKLPGYRPERCNLTAYFNFPEKKHSAILAIIGAFLAALGGAAVLLSGSVPLRPVLGMFAVAAAVCTLYTAFGLSREEPVSGMALLVPVCCAGVYLFWVYRTGASDPVLQAIYIRILAVSGLTYCTAERAAFAFENGNPRRYAAAAGITVVLCTAGFADGQGLAASLLFAGSALIELGFLTALRPAGSGSTQSPEAVP